MESVLSKKQRISFLLLSLLIHIALLMTLFVSFADPHAQKMFAQEKRAALVKVLQELPQKHPRWVATKARASQFGVPVIFDDEPPQPASAQTNPQTQSTSQPTTSGQPVNVATTHAEQQQVTQTKPQHDSDGASESKIEDSLNVSELKPLTVVENSDSALHQFADQKKQPEKITAAAAIAQKVTTPHGSSSQSTSQQTSGSGGIRKPITLAQIAKGFTENLKNKGTHSVTMRGSAQGIPTDEQLKYERYLQRLQWCIQNSIKIHEREFRTKVPPKTSLDIHIGIDRNGTLAELALVRSSGVPDLDEFILFTFKDASSSFPPVPAFFKEQLFTVLFIVKCMDVEQPGFRFFMQ